jgi:hypothetical protein
MTAQSFRPGDETFLASDSPTSAFSAVFEDDGDCGYFYAWDRDLPESARVLGAVMIYDVGRLPEQVREREVDMEIVWSAYGLKAGLRVGGGLQAVLDFQAREGFCRMGFPPVSAAWGGGARGAWSDGLVDRLR